MAMPILQFSADSIEPGAPGLDLDKLIASRMLIQANSGGGKSYALRALLEQTHGRVQQLVLDVEGEFATLRERFDYVLAGVEGDVPVSVESARVLCRRLMELQASCVINLYDLSLPDRRRYMRLFLEELMSLPRALWRPLLVVIDECHVFMPERGSGEAESKDAVIALATQGRKRGYCLVAATQRLSKLHKDGAAELLNKLIGRTSLDVDVKRAGDELGFSKAQNGQLKDLAPGTFYAYGPALSNVVTLTQIGVVQTSLPKAGRLGTGSAPAAPASMRSILAELGDLPERAAEEARTIEELQQRLEAVQSALRMSQLKRGAPKVVEKIVEKVVEVPVLEPEQISRLVDSAEAIRGLVKDLGGVAATLGHEINDVLTALEKAQAPTATPPPALSPAPRPALPSAAPPRPSTARSALPAGNNPEIKAGARRMLEVLAAHHPVRLTVSQLATLAKVKKSGGTFSTYFSTLKRNGLLEVVGNEVVITPSGLTFFGSARPAPATTEEIRDMYRSILKAGALRMFDILVALHPRRISKAELARRAEVSQSGGTFSTYLSTLRRNGLIDDNGEIKASDTVFMGSRYKRGNHGKTNNYQNH